MKLYERDLPGEFSLKNNFSDSAYDEFLDKLEKDYPELVPYFKNEDDFGYGSWFYEKALNFYSENKGDMDFGNIDKFVKDFLETEGKYIIKNLNKEKEKNDKLIAARKTGKVYGKKVWHWEYENDDDGTIQKFKTDGINPVNGTYDGVYESTKLSIKEAKEILKNQGYRVINEREINLNYLLKDIFELLTSFGISATDDEVKRLMWSYINSGRKPENATAEDILEFDIDNDPYTIIDYTGDFVDYIKKGQYKTGPVDESVQINEDADEPASSRQLWALFCIYKKDFRNQGLTKGEASELIKKGSSERPAKSSGKSLDAKICEHIETVLKPKLDKKMEAAFGNKSVVGDADLEGNLIPGRKRYKFFGGGCGFAWIKYDNRNKKLGEVTDRYLDIYRNKYFDKYCKEYIRKFKEKEMCAVLSQDLDIQYTIKQAALDFAESIGINIGKAYVDGRLD